VLVGPRAALPSVRNLTLRGAYATTEALGYCFPSENLVLLHSAIKHTRASDAAKHVFLAARGAFDSWRFLLGVAALCVLCGYAFLLVVWACFARLVYLLAGIAHVLLVASTAAFAYAGFHDDMNFLIGHFDSIMAKLCMFVCSLAALALWILWLIICLHGRKALDATIDSVNATSVVIGHLPTLLLQPLVHSGMVISVLTILLCGLARVLSTGKVRPADDPIGQNEIRIAGMQRSLDFSGWQWAFLVYWVFGIVWAVETVNALGRFAISHAVVTFASLDAKQWFPLMHGYLTGLRFHLGTLALGGFVVGCLKLLVAVLAFLARQARDDLGVQGSVSRAMCCCCAYCATCVEQAVSMVNELAYTDVALQGTAYMEAAENAMRVAGSSPAEYALLKASAGTVRIFGVVTISGSSTLLSYWLLSSPVVHEQLGRIMPGASSVLNTSSIAGTTAAAALISFNVAMAFMTVFYQANHSLVYSMLMGATTVGDAYPTSPQKRVALIRCDAA